MGTDMVHIPNKTGAAGMINDLVVGDAQVAVLNSASSAAMIKAGKLRPIAVIAEQRLKEYPDVPTLAEAGFPNVGTLHWQSMFAPAQTPKPVLETIFKAVQDAAKVPALQEAFAKQLVSVRPNASLEEAQSWHKNELATWRKTTSRGEDRPDGLMPVALDSRLRGNERERARISLPFVPAKAGTRELLEMYGRSCNEYAARSPCFVLPVLLFGSPAQAQDKYPSKPVRVMVPFGAGSATDITIRIVGEQMRQQTGHGFLVENKPGAGGSLAIEEMVKAPPDGYTLQVGNAGTNALSPIIYKSRYKFDYDKEVTMVTRLGEIPLILAATTVDFEPKTYAEFIAYAKANPGKVRYASVGTGSNNHYETEAYRAMGRHPAPSHPEQGRRRRHHQ